ncbi:carbohydrate ABC transporter permease [Candidatus Hakubella thermalkaliphila]|nr:sugar ABC transporter permease [Candidatus Hakubella thermalkaliphila]
MIKGGTLAMRKHLIYLLIIPLSFFLVSHTIQFFYGIGMSFYDGQGNFVGFENFLAVFKDATFRDSIRFSLVYSLAVTVAMTFLGLFIGIFINSLGGAQGFVKAIFLIPWAISLTVWALLVQIALSPRFGIVNHFLTTFGFVESPLLWLGDPSLARISVIAAVISKDVWFSALLFLVARQNLPVELYEEGKVAGATPWQALRYITLPLLRPAILYTGAILFIFSLQAFDFIYALTRGGPGFATEVAALTIYRHGVRYGNYEYGIAAATIWSLLVSVFVITVFAPAQRRFVER